ncbi:hypothetical protein EKM02_14280 [Flavobacterium sp. RSP49]|uniref:SEC-C metal-binding domain-containing protein n=1 Tax=Flavobacterium sp. RSP49 TaxID=2497487 RepID=UPI000F837E72|nr:hypothetical protein EKM02_14280 [Flavobacterium sp. RSP49]
MHSKLDRVSICFCGSGKKYRKCHKKGYDILSKFTIDNVHLFINALIETNEYILAVQKKSFGLHF